MERPRTYTSEHRDLIAAFIDGTIADKGGQIVIAIRIRSPNGRTLDDILAEQRASGANP